LTPEMGELLKLNGKAQEGTVEVGETEGARSSWAMPRGSSGVQVASTVVC